jgi:hypothetical protein
MRSRGIDVPQPIAAILAPTGITPSHVRTGSMHVETLVLSVQLELR